MSNRGCGGSFCGSLLFTSLRNDDLGGRDALYPVPQPSTVDLVAGGLALLAFRTGRYPEA